MSEIRTDTLSDAAGTGPATLIGQSAAKAFANWNGTGTVALGDTLNVSTLTDLGTGQQKITFTNNFASTGYCSTCSHDYSASGSDATLYSSGQKLAASLHMNSYGGGTTADATSCDVTCNGDLA